MSNYVEETIGKYEKYIIPLRQSCSALWAWQALKAEGWTITDSEVLELSTAWAATVCLL